jgi:ABC-type methionine transport system ATPase subunit
VREANLEIREGEVFVIMGLSGSRKSTILWCLNHLIQPTHGRVLIDGKDLNTLNGYSRKSQETVIRGGKEMGRKPPRNSEKLAQESQLTKHL